MNVKRSVIEQKSNEELEKYILPDSRFVPEAIQYAYEILELRGRVFSAEEIEIINALTKEEEQLPVHKNYIKSSNFFLASIPLGIINMLLMPEFFNSGSDIFSGIITLLFLLGIGIFIRKGFDWMKYVLLVIMLIGFFGYPAMLQLLLHYPVVGGISLLQTALQIISLCLLFSMPQHTPLERHEGK
jgi:hypothetical protein